MPKSHESGPDAKGKLKKKIKKERDTTWTSRGTGHAGNGGYASRAVTGIKFGVRKSARNPTFSPLSEAKLNLNLFNRLGVEVPDYEVTTTPSSYKARSASSTPAKKQLRKNGEEWVEFNAAGAFRFFKHPDAVGTDAAKKPSAVKTLTFEEAEKIKENIQEAVAPVKRQEFEVSKDNAKKVRRELAANAGRRAIPQSKAVAKVGQISATDYAIATLPAEEFIVKATIDSKRQKREWAHLKRYRQGGKSSQVITNLICTTPGFNTMMAFVESLEPLLLAAYGKDNYREEISANLREIEQDGKKIFSHHPTGHLIYKLITPDFVKDFSLKVIYEHGEPIIGIAQVLRIELEETIKIAQEKKLGPKPGM